MLESLHPANAQNSDIFCIKKYIMSPAYKQLMHLPSTRKRWYIHFLHVIILFSYSMQGNLLFLNKSHLILIKNLAQAAKVRFVWINYNNFEVTLDAYLVPCSYLNQPSMFWLCLPVKDILLLGKASVKEKDGSDPNIFQWFFFIKKYPWIKKKLSLMMQFILNYWVILLFIVRLLLD